MRASIFIAIAFAFSPSAAMAQTSTGQLVLHCKAAIRGIEKSGPISDEDYLNAGHCLGYLGGIAHTLSTLKGNGFQKSAICLPEAWDATQLAKVFVRYAEDAPQLHHEHMFLGVLAAYARAFPCAGSN